MPVDAQPLTANQICEAVRSGGEVVWANTAVQEGLLGRSDLPLRTAVGAPIYNLGQDICILVLFSPSVVQVNEVESVAPVLRPVMHSVSWVSCPAPWLVTLCLRLVVDSVLLEVGGRGRDRLVNDEHGRERRSVKKDD